MRYQRTLSELETKLADRIRLMRRSAEYFDAGDESEAAQLATHIRVLVHDPADLTRSRSRSLLAQLGLKHQMGYVDTTIRRPSLPPGYAELPPGSIVIHSGITITEIGGANGVRFRAPLADLAPERVGPPVSFEEWWTPEILNDQEGNSHSRRSVVIDLANQDGAHIDATLSSRHAALTKRNALGREGTGTDDQMRPLDNIVEASVRQVVFELDRSLLIARPGLYWQRSRNRPHF